MYTLSEERKRGEMMRIVLALLLVISMSNVFAMGELRVLTRANAAETSTRNTHYREVVQIADQTCTDYHRYAVSQRDIKFPSGVSQVEVEMNVSKYEEDRQKLAAHTNKTEWKVDVVVLKNVRPYMGEETEKASQLMDKNKVPYKVADELLYVKKKGVSKK